MHFEFEEEPQAKVDQERISISIVPQQGRFRRSIPCMPMGLAIFCCILNIFLPGSGTLVSAFSVLCCSDVSTSSSSTRISCFSANLLAAFLQFLTSIFIIGIIWSIIWGILFIQIERKWFIASIDNRYSSVDCCPCSRW